MAVSSSANISYTLEVPPHVRALLFDCDGTLANTMEMHWRVWHECLNHFGVTCPHEVLSTFGGVPIVPTVQALNARFGWSIDPHEFAIFRKNAVLSSLHQAKPIDSVVAVARKYHGVLPMAVVSGGSSLEVNTTLDAIGVSDLFDCRVTADSGVPGKPSPAPFLKAAEILGVPASYCQVFEDADPGIQAGLSAGMLVVDVRPITAA